MTIARKYGMLIGKERSIMKKIGLLALCLAGITGFAQEIVIDKDLTSWEKFGKNVASDAAINTSGKYSLRLGSNSQATRRVTLEMNQDYKVTFNIRGKDIQSTLFTCQIPFASASEMIHQRMIIITYNK